MKFSTYLLSLFLFIPSASTLVAGSGVHSLSTDSNGKVHINLRDGSSTQIATKYEEGKWTPTDESGAGLSFTVFDCRYTRIGRMVFFSGSITFPATANTNDIAIGGLPYLALTGDDNTGSINFSGNTLRSTDFGRIGRGSRKFFIETATTGDNAVDNNVYSGIRITFTGQYEAQ